ncbi:response regulator transcription factor, partial [Pseudomonas sp. Pseusp97]|uniref:helix-turn-helix transcriptional regulator n=1 Tax=Pseudomonas sp. Pseusp97 TaxID=3243065 RepID=UPI0039A63B97
RQGCLASEVLIDCDRVRLCLLAGERDQARSLLDACRERLPDGGEGHELLRGRLAFLDGELLLLQGDAPAATLALENGARLARACADPYILHGLLGLGEAASRSADAASAQRYCEEAERRMHCWKVQPDCYRLPLESLKLRLLARQGQWLRLYHEATALEAELEQRPERVAPLHTPSLPQRVRYLLALAEAGCGRIEAARARLLALREECLGLGYQALASEVEQALHSLKVEMAPERLPSLLPTSSGEVADSAHGLTAREVAVLRLLAEGLSNQEIGNSLFISLNTVKTHAKKINVKLGVRRRTQAIVRAKSLGLLG